VVLLIRIANILRYVGFDIIYPIALAVFSYLLVTSVL
jgi:hypothetical protein